MNNITLSASSIVNFQTCRKRYAYEKIMGLVPVDTAPALSFGRLVHRGLQMLFDYQKNGLLYDIREEQRAKFAREIIADEVLHRAQKDGVTSQDALKAARMLDAYIDLYLDEDMRRYKVVAVEHEFRLPILNPSSGRVCNARLMHGFVDAIVRSWDDGRLYIVEHKTTSALSQEYFDRVSIDWQVAIYAHFITREYDEPVAGVIYDVLKKPGIRRLNNKTNGEETDEAFSERLKATITPEDFVRQTVILDEQQTTAFLVDLWDAAKEIASCNNFYKCTGACLGKFGTCPFLQLCCAGGDLHGLEDKYIQRNEAQNQNQTENEEVV